MAANDRQAVEILRLKYSIDFYRVWSHAQHEPLWANLLQSENDSSDDDQSDEEDLDKGSHASRKVAAAESKPVMVLTSVLGEPRETMDGKEAVFRYLLVQILSCVNASEDVSHRLASDEIPLQVFALECVDTAMNSTWKLQSNTDSSCAGFTHVKARIFIGIVGPQYIRAAVYDSPCAAGCSLTPTCVLQRVLVCRQ